MSRILLALAASWKQQTGRFPYGFCSRARSSKRVNSLRKVSGTSPSARALLGDDELGFAFDLFFFLLGVRVVFLPHEQANEIGVLLDAARFVHSLRRGRALLSPVGSPDFDMSRWGELQHALAAAKEPDEGTRVVSMPCFERFARQSDSYREEVLPNECRKRVAIEAGVPQIWAQYVGLDGKIVGAAPFRHERPGQ